MQLRCRKKGHWPSQTALIILIGMSDAVTMTADTTEIPRMRTRYEFINLASFPHASIYLDMTVNAQSQEHTVKAV